MQALIRVSTQVARKEYVCNASEWIENIVMDDIGAYAFTYTELRAIVRARRNKWRIKPGEEYRKEIHVEGGDIYTWRAIPAIHDICVKYDIYDY